MGQASPSTPSGGGGSPGLAGGIFPVNKKGIGQSSAMTDEEARLKREEEEERKKAEQERIEAERARFGGGGGVTVKSDTNNGSLLG